MPVPHRLLALASFFLRAGACAALLGNSPARAWSAEPGLPPGRVLLKSYGSEQGLDNLAITHLAQDAQGYIWAGTQEGLYRYNGTHFQSFHLGSGLPSTRITTLFVAPDGRLWAGTWQGLAQFDQGKFISTPGAPPTKVNAVAQLPNSPLWIGTREGLFRSRERGDLTRAQGWPSGEVTALCLSSQPRAVWAAFGARLYRQEGSGPIQRLPALPGQGQDPIGLLLADAQGRIFARTTSQLWGRFPGHEAFQNLHLPSAPASIQRAILAQDSRGHLWVPTPQGLATLTEGNWKQVPTGGVHPVMAQAILSDQEGSLWIGGSGLHRIIGLNAWRRYIPQEGLLNHRVGAIVRDRHRQLWIGTPNGLYRSSPQGWGQIPGTQGIDIRTLLQSRDGHLWLGGMGGELLRVHPRTQTVHLLKKQGRSQAPGILKLLEDRQGTLWAATESEGLQQIVRAPTIAFNREHLPDESPQERINSLLQDASGHLWACGEQGLACRTEQGWIRYTQGNGLRRTHTASLVQLPQGEFRLAYFDAAGITRFEIDREGLRIISHLDQHSGLSSDCISIMGEDAKGRFWAGTDRGLAIQEGGNWKHLGQTEDLAGQIGNPQAFLADPSGEVWLGTSSGLYRFLGASIHQAACHPSSVILQASLGGHAIPQESHTFFLQNRRADYLDVTFSSLSFLHENSLEHQYRLLGHDNEWKNTRTGEAHYSRLAPGSYEFQVRARTPHSEWGAIAKLPFGIRPSWWQRKWVQALIGALLLTATARALIWHIRGLKRRNMELEILLKLADSLTKELESTNLNLRDQNLTDPLTGLRNRRYLSATIERDLAQVERLHCMRDEHDTDDELQNISLLFFMVDIDHFKWVNDTYGHAAGDCVLKQFSEVLQSATRGSDSVIRWGGEEFLVVARQSQPDEAIVLAERIRHLAEARRFDIAHGPIIRRTCSIGFAPYPVNGFTPESMSWEQVIHLADQCLYMAKSNGRNQWIGLSPRETSAPPSSPILCPDELAQVLKAGILKLRRSKEPS